MGAPERRLEVHLSSRTLLGLSPLLARWTAHERARDGGFDGLQYVIPGLGTSPIAADLGLRCSVSARFGGLPVVRDLWTAGRAWHRAGARCAVLSVGSDRDADEQVDVWLEELIEVSAQLGLPMFVRLQRGTITQDLYRTLRLIERHPGVRFCGDFGQWVVAHGGWDASWLGELEPVLMRTRALQLRIGSATRVQCCEAREDQLGVCLQRWLWRRCLASWRDDAAADEVFVASIELGGVRHGEAAVARVAGHWEELGDRWQQARWLARWVRRDLQHAPGPCPVVERSERSSVQRHPVHFPPSHDPALLLEVHQTTLPERSAVALAGPFCGVHVDSGCAWPGVPTTLCVELRQLPELDALRALAEGWQQSGLCGVTLALGTALASDDQALAVLSSVLEVQEALGLPLWLETRRGTLTGDLRRTLGWVHRLPELRFCLDLAEWYVGHDLDASDVQDALLYLEPVFARSPLVRGRVATRSCVRTEVGQGSTGPTLSVTWQQIRRALRHHLAAWSRCAVGCRREGVPLRFVVDLPPGRDVQLPDAERWEQALVLARLARQCVLDARWQ